MSDVEADKDSPATADPSCVPCAAGRTADPDAWQQQLRQLLELDDLPETASSTYTDALAPVTLTGGNYRLVVVDPFARRASQGRIGDELPEAFDWAEVAPFKALLAGESPAGFAVLRPAPRLLLVQADHADQDLNAPGSFRSVQLTFTEAGVLLLAEFRWASWHDGENWEGGSLAILPASEPDTHATGAATP